MSQNRFTRNLSANTVQLFINQFFGLVIFYALSKGLNKDLFGQVNWSLAVLLTVFGVLSFGIDQVMVKKIAAGYNRQAVFTAYLLHVLISGGIFYGLLFLGYLFFHASLPQLALLFIIGTGKIFIFLSSPFKQLVTGLEKFRALLFMSVGSNIIRGAALLVLLIVKSISINKVLFIFITGDLLELLCCIIVAGPLLKKPFINTRSKRIQYLLLKESLPQAGVVVFTAIMSRFDWILVGILVSSSKLAEYSFAWKAFEVATLPLLIIAPLMIPLFTRLFRLPGPIAGLSFFLEWQIIIASFIALLLNLCWVPVADFITDGKYGAVNGPTILLLSLSMPLLYVNNYLWTINFARGKLKRIFLIMAVAFVVNIAACSILIPLYKNEGAAFAFFCTLLVQLMLYLQHTGFPSPAARRHFLLVWPLAALLCGTFAKQYLGNTTLSLVIAAALYALLVFCSGQVRQKDWKTLQSLYQ